MKQKLKLKHSRKDIIAMDRNRLNLERILPAKQSKTPYKLIIVNFQGRYAIQKLTVKVKK